jgi:hypothetical protein
MSRPEHYSHDIVQRCESLIRHLSPIIKRGLPDDEKFGGPLDTTFLLALATPMILFPLERIYTPGKYPDNVADDRDIDSQLTAEVDAVLGGCTLADAPWGMKDRWQFVPAYLPLFDLADGCPPDLLQKLASPDATTKANTASASVVLRVLRNALGHGGVAYLDKEGMTTDKEAVMLAFVSHEKDKRQIVGLNALRISERDFRGFLSAWAGWIKSQRHGS